MGEHPKKAKKLLVICRDCGHRFLAISWGKSSQPTKLCEKCGGETDYGWFVARQERLAKRKKPLDKPET
jgi:rRNA maturation endonuclease Nob1